MIKKGIVVIILTMVASCLIVSYADESKDVSSSKSVPETYTLGSITNIYEPVEFTHETHALITES